MGIFGLIYIRKNEIVVEKVTDENRELMVKSLNDVPAKFWVRFEQNDIAKICFSTRAEALAVRAYISLKLNMTNYPGQKDYIYFSDGTSIAIEDPDNEDNPVDGNTEPCSDTNASSDHCLDHGDPDDHANSVEDIEQSLDPNAGSDHGSDHCDPDDDSSVASEPFSDTFTVSDQDSDSVDDATYYTPKQCVKLEQEMRATWYQDQDSLRLAWVDTQNALLKQYMQFQQLMAKMFENGRKEQLQIWRRKQRGMCDAFDHVNTSIKIKASRPKCREDLKPIIEVKKKFMDLSLLIKPKKPPIEFPDLDKMLTPTGNPIPLDDSMEDNDPLPLDNPRQPGHPFPIDNLRQPDNPLPIDNPRRPDNPLPIDNPRRPDNPLPLDNPRRPGNPFPLDNPRRPGNPFPLDNPRRPGNPLPLDNPRQPNNPGPNTYHIYPNNPALPDKPIKLSNPPFRKKRKQLSSPVPGNKSEIGEEQRIMNENLNGLDKLDINLKNRKDAIVDTNHPLISDLKLKCNSSGHVSIDNFCNSSGVSSRDNGSTFSSNRSSTVSEFSTSSEENQYLSSGLDEDIDMKD